MKSRGFGKDIFDIGVNEFLNELLCVNPIKTLQGEGHASLCSSKWKSCVARKKWEISTAVSK